jgi:hypothetical protein
MNLILSMPWTMFLSRLNNDSSQSQNYTDRRSVCLGIKHSSGAYDQIFITVRQLEAYSCGALSLTRGRIYRLQILLVLASAVIFGSESRGTRDHILLSQIRDFHFHPLFVYEVTVAFQSVAVNMPPAVQQTTATVRLASCCPAPDFYSC